MTRSELFCSLAAAHHTGTTGKNRWNWPAENIRKHNEWRHAWWLELRKNFPDIFREHADIDPR